MERELIKVKDRPGLVRDKASGGILNTDLESLDKYRAERDYQNRVARAVMGYEKMSAEVSEIRSMLLELLQKK
jgi:hypothetical protein